MVELFESDIKNNNRQSSKGNQLKWNKGNVWYKADYTGYEGLTEYIVSKLLGYSDMKQDEYVDYETEKIVYNNNSYLGCVSRNFLPEGWKMITLERLFKNMYGESLTKAVYKIENYTDRVEFVVSNIMRITGLNEFDVYFSKIMTIDTLFLNEDRHMHNIAVLTDEKGKYQYCPVFDNGSALLSDTTMDYPIGGYIEEMMQSAKAKTICQDFDEQLDVVEQVCGCHIKFNFHRKDVEKLLEEEPYYDKNVKERVRDIIMSRTRKYQYLF